MATLPSLSRLASGIAYGATSGRIGTDLTPGYSATNVARTQAGNAVNAIGNTFNSGNEQIGGGVGGQYYTQADPKGIGTDRAATGVYNANQAASQALVDKYGNPADLDNQINNYNGQLGDLQGQQDVGFANVNDQYMTQHNRLAADQGGAEKQYNTGIQQNTQSYQNNRTKVLNSARSNANALQRLLGINGAGNSSAASEQAPYAAALQGSQDIGEAQQTFGNNSTNLSNNWEDAQRKYKDAFSDLDTQKFQGENSVRSQAAQARAALLDKIDTATMNRNLAKGGAAGARAHQAEIDNLLQQVTQLGRSNPNPVLQAQAVNTAPMQLTDYAQGRNLVAQNQQTPGGDDISANFLSTLAGAKKDRFGQPIAY
jgi:hypothetical protein